MSTRIHKILIIITIAVVSITMLFKKGSMFEKGDATFCLLSLLIGVIIYFHAQKKTAFRGYWIRPSNVLLLGLLIVNFQFIADYVLGLKPYYFFDYPSSLLLTCYYSAIGVLIFILGAIPSSSNTLQQNNSTNNETRVIKRINIFPLVVLQIAFFISWIFTVNIIELLLGKLYGTGEGSSNVFEGLFYNTSLAIMISIAINGEKEGVRSLWGFLKQNNIFSWLCMGLYMVIRLVSGDRGPCIYTFLAIFFTYIYVTKAKIKLGSLLIAGTFAAISLTLVGIARKTTEDSFFSRMGSAYEQYTDVLEQDGYFSILPPTSELAGSSRCNMIAIDEIENKGKPLHYGRYQFYELIQCIPFMPSFLTYTLKIPPKELFSDYYLTLVFFGDYTLWGQIGTTCIADFYLDFGLLGIIVGMFLTGLLFKRIDRVLLFDKAVTPNLLIILIMFASKAIYIPRSMVLGTFKPFIEISVIFYFNYMLFNSRKVLSLR